ncbi:unnamed protein product [Rhodiola kirilowii]
MACVSTAKFSVMINGSLEGYFASSRGLRQGTFSIIQCARICMIHLLFTEDVIIFSKANPDSLSKVKDTLRTFHKCSGLKVNVDKSANYFGGCSELEENMLASIVNFQKGQLPFTYLGVPLQGRQFKEIDYSVIIDKMTNKIKSWGAKCLSYAGRLVLVKHDLSTI